MRSKPERTVLNDNEMIPGMYGYGSIMPGGAMPKTRRVAGSASPESSGVASSSKDNPEELNTQANEIYKKGNFAEALSLYDKAIAISPGDGRFHCTRAAALMGLKRIIEAAKECEEAIRLSPTYVRAHQRLGSLLLWLYRKLRVKCAIFGYLCHLDWTTTLQETEAATTSGADSSPQLFACQAEAHLKLHQLKDAELWIYKARTYEPSATARQSNFFGMLSEAYVFFVQAQIDSTLGKFDDACIAIERAARIDLQSAEVTGKLKNMRLVGKARTLGNEHFHSKRYAQDCSAYGEGLLLDSSNSILYYNRANCWFKLGEFEKSLADSNHALLIRPQYTKALFRKATSNIKGNDLFFCFLLKVDVKQSPAIATAEKITVVPTFTLYKDGSCVVDTVTATPDLLEFLIKNTLFDPI
uniref:Small glutamine-rich tetratricopeptide repeat-containing protein A n=1 Tax=Solanum tuberosum TaxID=4113 RepID=M1BX12_SOLTU